MEINSSDPNLLDNYLKMVSGIRKGSMRTVPSSISHIGLEDLVLKFGKEYNPQTLPQKYKKDKGKAKLCYMNAFKLVHKHPELTYVEGYANSVIPMEHAWAVDKEGNVVDVTWPEVGSHYRGIPFTTEQLDTIASVRGVYGIFDDWQNGNPAYSIKNFTPAKLAAFYKKLSSKERD